MNRSSRRNNPSYNRYHRIVASSSAGVIQRLIQVASTLVVMPVMLRVLGPARFGIWGAAASLAWVSGLADLGTGAALVTLVSRSSALEDAVTARRHIGGALTLGSALACLLILLGMGAWRLNIPGIGSSLAVIAVIGLAVNVPLSSANSVWMALQKGYVAWFWELVQTVLTTGGLLVAATRTTEVWIYAAVVYGSLVLANLGSLAHLLWIHPELRPHGLLAPLKAVREVAGHGVMYFLMGLAGGLSFLLDNVLALALLGPEASARMAIALRVCMTGLGALLVLSQPFWPAFAEAAEKGQRHWIRKVLLRGSALLVSSTLAGSIILLVYGERLLRWWLHGSLEISKGLLWAIAAWMLSQAIFRVPHLLLNGLSIIRFQIVLMSATTLVALVLKLSLSRSFGDEGILWGTTMPVFLIAIPVAVWRIHRWIQDEHSLPSGAPKDAAETKAFEQNIVQSP